MANFATRLFPFLFFVNHEPPALVIFVERAFPPIIMTILIFYSLKNIEVNIAPYGFSEIFAVILTFLVHLGFKNYLISIFTGTLFYMAMLQYVF
jgi:branched-subunit amino acid transport protein AzlD